MKPLYCNSLTSYSRYLSSEVRIGDLILGGKNPIRVQSMTTTDTMDTAATVAQSIRMIEAGCELVRITAPSIKDAQNLDLIKKELRKQGYNTPLVADIHFTPNAAELAARIVEKVRVNPGNYADKKKFETHDYSDSSYHAELERIRDRFVPLIRICKEYGTAMRIGTNHGSLSDRIMSRYGDTAIGMVESALEFLRICGDENYHQIVLSMKSSNPQVMVQAYRLLITKMRDEGMNYPLHLGVTEAGEGEDGRIKSALGIGTLLEDGIGDTIRVSLTEDPEFEIPVAKALVARYSDRAGHAPIEEVKTFPEKYDPYQYHRRESIEVMNLGHGHVPVVVADLSHAAELNPASFFPLGYTYSIPNDKWNISDSACDLIYTGDKTIDFEIPGTLGLIHNSETWLSLKNNERRYPLFCGSQIINAEKIHPSLNFVAIDHTSLTENFLEKMKSRKDIVLILETSNQHGMAEQRRVFFTLEEAGIDLPVIIKRNYKNTDQDNMLLHASTDTGALFIDGMGDGIWLNTSGKINPRFVNDLSFGILQASRLRISKTEYISCPSCGRTLFDLQETTAKIRKRTTHLKGLKIGIMGCIVNGPGEMADADYGYVGTGIGKITLYKGQEVVARNIPSEQAVDALIELIRKHGDWVEAEAVNA